MKENSFIYLRGLKHAAFTVFCVEDGQKSYYDPQFNVRVPFASGQQVKRSILEQLNDVLGVQPSPTEFFFDVDKKGALKEGEVLSSCDPHYVDQLLGGWMRTPKGGKEKAVKRRSPFSISAMTPLHPLLAAVSKENISFDRSDKPNVHKVVVRDANGNRLTDEQVSDFLEGNDRSLYRKWIPDNSRATGLFVYDVAIDLRRLFCVSTNQLEPEITSDMVEKLKEDGWKIITTSFGECLLMPKEQREQIIPAISEIFKPIIVDRVIFKVLNKHALSTSHFDKKLNKCLLNEKGKKIFVKAMEERYDETFRHRSLGRNVSYKHLIKLECYKLLKDILGIEDYKPFKMYW